MLTVYRCFFYMLLTFVLLLSLLPLGDDFVTTGWDKTNHMLGFFVLMVSIDAAYPAAHFWQKKVLSLVLFGLLVELLQGLTAYRFFSWLDLLADCVGLALYYPFKSIFRSLTQYIDGVFQKNG